MRRLLASVAGTLIAIGDFDPAEAHQLLDEATASMSRPLQSN
jgi:hypothetical protein